MRTTQDIDREYNTVATIYGDRVFKESLLQDEIKNLHDKLTSLITELATHQQKPTQLTEQTKKTS